MQVIGCQTRCFQLSPIWKRRRKRVMSPLRARNTAWNENIGPDSDNAAHANTLLLLVEVANSEICWTEPRDIDQRYAAARSAIFRLSARAAATTNGPRLHVPTAVCGDSLRTLPQQLSRKVCQSAQREMWIGERLGQSRQPERPRLGAMAVMPSLARMVAFRCDSALSRATKRNRKNTRTFREPVSSRYFQISNLRFHITSPAESRSCSSYTLRRPAGRRG